jgi:hypothetical protein
MRIFTNHTFTWWETSLLKICLITLGILLGLYFFNFLAGLTWLWWVLFIFTAVYFVTKAVFNKGNSFPLINPGKATKVKKVIYLLASTTLGILLSIIAHSLIEINYLNWALEKGNTVVFNSGCALPLWLQTSLWVAGTLGGFFMGTYWWRKLYIERVWNKKRSKR